MSLPLSISGGAVSILDSVAQDAGVDYANYMRCISGTYYNLAGLLYQATRYGAAVPFLREACLLGAKALSMKGRGNGNGKAKEEANPETKTEKLNEISWKSSSTVPGSCSLFVIVRMGIAR